MPFYEHECPDCGKKRTVVRSVAARDEPEFCEHRIELANGKRHIRMAKMDRVVSRFQAITDRECDRPENQLGRILTKSNSRSDWLAVEKKHIAQQERNAAKYDTHEEKPVSLGDILKTGIRPDWSREKIQNWRKDNVKKDDFAAVSGD